MNEKAVRISLMFALGLIAGVIFVLRKDDAPAAVPVASAAVRAAAMPGATPAAPATSGPGAVQGALPAPAPSDDRAATQAVRRDTLPEVLRIADASIAAAQADIAGMREHGAARADIDRQEARLERMQAARRQLIARNADVYAAK